MRYFYKLTPEIEEQFTQRAVDMQKLLYCVKADMDGEGKYVDVYITFDKENLYILSGAETLEKKGHRLIPHFNFERYDVYPLTGVTELYIDRYRNTARMMAKLADLNAPTTEENIPVTEKAVPDIENISENTENEKIDEQEKPKQAEINLARFSVGFAEKFEKFAVRYNKTVKGEEINDQSLEDELPECPKCGMIYPDPNRRFCPNCVKRSSIFKRLLAMFKNFKKQTIILMIFILISVALGLIAPYFGTALLYDEVLNEAGSLYGEILYVVIMMAGFQLFSTVFSMAYGITVARITPTVTHRLRTDIFASMQRLSLSFYTSKQTSSLMTRVDRDSLEIYFFFTDMVPYGLACITRLIGLIVLMVSINWLIAICMLGVMAIVIGFEVFWVRGQRRLWRNRDLARRGVNQVLTDALNGHRVVKAFAREKQEVKRFGDKNHGLYSAEYNRDMRSARLEPFQRGIYAIGNAAIYCLGVYLVLTGSLAFGGLALLISYFGISWEPLFFFVYAGNDLARCVDAASRMFEILDSEPTVKPPKEPTEPADGNLKGDIMLKDINFEYEAGRPIIKHLDVNIKAGQFFGIVGKTGAGKSTIINLISRMYDVTNGEIIIDGIPLKQLDFKTLRRNIGVVSQETYLFMGTIADNIRYARPEAGMEEVIEAAKSANAHDFIIKLPDSYDTIIGSGGHNLSGGERQRISIARALIQRPNILILDEATAAMDTKTERKIQAAIDNLKSGRTIIAIAHRLSTLRDADVLCVIENGEVKEQGTHDELIYQKGKYFELYKLQAEALKTIGVD